MMKSVGFVVAVAAAALPWMCRAVPLRLAEIDSLGEAYEAEPPSSVLETAQKKSVEVSSKEG